MLNRLKRAIRWLELHPKHLLFSIVCFGAGLLTAYPLGWTLLPANADLVGAMLGAGLAVAGAFWLQQHQALKDRREFGTALIAVMQPVLVEAVVTASALNIDMAQPQAREKKKRAVRLLAERIEKYRQQHDTIEVPLAMVGYVGKTRMLEWDEAVAAFYETYAGTANQPAVEALADFLRGYAELVALVDTLIEKGNAFVKHFSEI